MQNIDIVDNRIKRNNKSVLFFFRYCLWEKGEQIITLTGILNLNKKYMVDQLV
jgi:hypothetical protein